MPSSAYIIKLNEYTGTYWVYSFKNAHVALVFSKDFLGRAFDISLEKF